MEAMEIDIAKLNAHIAGLLDKKKRERTNYLQLHKNFKRWQKSKREYIER
jgi:hypothetical protein